MVDFITDISLITMVLLLLPATYRVAIGPSAADRLQAIDAITTILIGIIVLLAFVQESVFLIDIAIALAAFAFIATIAIARYLCEGRIF